MFLHIISLTNISSYAILTIRLPTTKYNKKAIKLVDIVANEDNVTNIAHIGETVGIQAGINDQYANAYNFRLEKK